MNLHKISFSERGSITSDMFSSFLSRNKIPYSIQWIDNPLYCLNKSFICLKYIREICFTHDGSSALSLCINDQINSGKFSLISCISFFRLFTGTGLMDSKRSITSYVKEYHPEINLSVS